MTFLRPWNNFQDKNRHSHIKTRNMTNRVITDHWWGAECDYWSLVRCWMWLLIIGEVLNVITDHWWGAEGDYWSLVRCWMWFNKTKFFLEWFLSMIWDGFSLIIDGDTPRAKIHQYYVTTCFITVEHCFGFHLSNPYPVQMCTVHNTYINQLLFC